MNVRFLAFSALALLASTAFCQTQAAQAKSPSKAAPHSAKDAAAVHASAIVIDTHADTPQRFVDDGYDLDQPGAQVNLPDAKKGNLGAEFFSIWVEPTLYKDHYAKRTLELIDSVYQQAAKHPTEMRMAFSPADIEAAHREHKLAALMGIEGGHSIENSLALLRDYYRLGVRYMTLTWSNSNDWADSSGDADDAKVPHTKEGLTEFGKDVVYEMNRLGMMVDVSHVSDKTFIRTLIITRAPVIASHSGSRALCSAKRNMTDDMLRQMAINGGVVQVNFFSAFVSQQYYDAFIKLQPEIAKAQAELDAKYKVQGKPTPYSEYDKLQREWAAKIPRPPFSALIDQIDHIAKVAGVDHVGIGSDFDGIPTSPEGIDTVADLPKISAALLQRGYSPEDVHKIMGGNLLRVFRQVEQVSRDLKSVEQRPRISQKQP
jgi:membrane dipeptidase